jgi:hypothetical protein
MIAAAATVLKNSFFMPYPFICLFDWKSYASRPASKLMRPRRTCTHSRGEKEAILVGFLGF